MSKFIKAINRLKVFPVQTPKNLWYMLDIGDVGNELGILLGSILDEEGDMEDFINGFKHGVSLEDGTHNLPDVKEDWIKHASDYGLHHPSPLIYLISMAYKGKYDSKSKFDPEDFENKVVPVEAAIEAVRIAEQKMIQKHALDELVRQAQEWGEYDLENKILEEE